MGPGGTLTESGILGRDDLLALAERRLDAVQRQEGHVLLLTGEAGIGKTRLLTAIADLAADRGFATYSAAVFPQDLVLSGGLLLDLGQDLARVEDPRIAGLGRAFADDLSEMVPSTEQAHTGDAHRRRRLLVGTSADRLLSLAVDRPVLLCLEDLQWADDMSLDVLTQVARRRRGTRICVVGTIRTEDVSGDAPVRHWRSRMVLQRMAEDVRLSRLDLADTARLVRALLPGQQPAQRLVELVHERSGGVPLHVEELVAAAGAGRLASDPAYVPETLADAVVQRCAALSEDARRLAVAAAVVGRSFDVDLLAAVDGCSPDAAASGVDELVVRLFLAPEPSGPPGWYHFRHALIRDAIAREASLVARRRLHGRVADVAEQRPELGGDAYRAGHLEAAGRTSEAATAATRAAERASRLSAHREALDLLHLAVRCTGADAPPGRLADLLLARGREAAACDDNDLAAADLDRARALLADSGDIVGAARATAPLVAIRHLLGDDLDTRVDVLDRALAELLGNGPVAPVDATDALSEARAELLAAKAAAYMLDRRLDPSIVAAEQALAVRGAGVPTRINTEITLGAVRVFAGHMDEGWRALEAGTARARELGLEEEAARGYRMLATSASVLVEYDRAEPALLAGIEYAARTEQWNHRHYMLSHLAHVHWARGTWAEADTCVDQALADGEGGITTRITALCVRGYLALGRGLTDVAVGTLTEARALGTEMAELQRYSPAVWGLAELAVLTEDHATAVDLTELGYRSSHELGDAAYLFPFLVTGTRARLALRDPTGAQEWVDRVGAAVRARDIPGSRPALDHAAGLLHLAAGRTGQARQVLSAARGAWLARSRWWEGRWVTLDLARCALASHRRTEAATLVEEVRRDASALGSAPLLAACDGIAGRLDRGDAAEAWSPLTLRELEVARLVARGLTNREIAETLHISVRTAGSHLEHINLKLGTVRRSEIAAWVASLDLPEPAPRTPR